MRFFGLKALLVVLGVSLFVSCAPTVSTASLHEAAYKGHTEDVEALIKAGANVNTKDKDGNTPLHGAAYKGHAGVVEALAKAGANVNAKNKKGDTPLDLAIRKGHTEVAEILKKAGAHE